MTMANHRWKYCESDIDDEKWPRLGSLDDSERLGYENLESGDKSSGLVGYLSGSTLTLSVKFDMLESV